MQRPDGAVLFRTASGPVTASGFLRAAHRLAPALPDAPMVLNLCADRFSFALVFAAALLRGQVSLLTGDRSADRLRTIGLVHPDAVQVSDSAGSPLRPLLAVPAGADDAACPTPVIPADRLAAIVFTSGSTGEPVGHRKLWGALAARSIAAGLQFGLAEDHPATVIGTVPPQHMYGFETTVLQPLHAPCASTCGHALFPADVADAMRAAPAPRLLVTTPLQLQALLRADAVLPPTEALVSATAPLEAATAAAAEARWNTRALEIFGATEVGSIASRRTVAGDRWQLYPGLSLHAGADGTAEVSAPFAPAWPLSDIVEKLDDEHFRLLGRRADLVKLGGRRASLAGLNLILNGLDGVQDGVFVPPENPNAPTARMLAFAVAPGRSPESLLAALRNRVDPAFLPRRVVLVPSLPRNAVGKLPHQALAGLAAAAGDPPPP